MAAFSNYISEYQNYYVKILELLLSIICLKWHNVDICVAQWLRYSPATLKVLGLIPFHGFYEQNLGCLSTTPDIKLESALHLNIGI